MQGDFIRSESSFRNWVTVDGHFKCNRQRLIDYPNLWSYTRELYQWPGIDATVRLDHIKAHYYGSHPSLNPSGIVPKGPMLELAQPPGRDHL